MGKRQVVRYATQAEAQIDGLLAEARQAMFVGHHRAALAAARTAAEELQAWIDRQAAGKA